MGTVQQVFAFHCSSDQCSITSLHETVPLFSPCYICLSEAPSLGTHTHTHPLRSSLLAALSECSRLTIFLPQMNASHLGTCKRQSGGTSSLCSGRLVGAFAAVDSSLRGTIKVDLWIYYALNYIFLYTFLLLTEKLNPSIILQIQPVSNTVYLQGRMSYFKMGVGAHIVI